VSRGCSLFAPHSQRRLQDKESPIALAVPTRRSLIGAWNSSYALRRRDRETLADLLGQEICGGRIRSSLLISSKTTGLSTSTRPSSLQSEFRRHNTTHPAPSDRQFSIVAPEPGAQDPDERRPEKRV